MDQNIEIVKNPVASEMAQSISQYELMEKEILDLREANKILITVLAELKKSLNAITLLNEEIEEEVKEEKQ